MTQSYCWNLQRLQHSRNNNSLLSSHVQIFPTFLHMLPVAVAQFSSDDDNAASYVPPVMFEVMFSHSLTIRWGITIPSPTLSFIADLKPSFSADPSHRSLSFSSSGLITGIPQSFTVTFEHIRLYFLVFLFLHFLVVGSVP